MSLAQLKVMSAIETCRTAALGGHLERCEDCAHERVSYNSCRNRHCPKCQAAAARQWLEDREAELLPVPYYHVVFTLPAAIGAVAFQNKAAVYDLLFRTAADTLTIIAAAPGDRRAFAEFAQGDLPDKMHAALIERSLGGRIVGVIARDATEIEAREKPVKTEPNDKKEDPPPPDGAQGRRISSKS